jgi:hypothetical protein
VGVSTSTQRPGGPPYSISESARGRLEGLVDRIEAKPGDLIDLREFIERQQTLDVAEVMRMLPEGLNEDDLAGILHLALLTECATESYAAAIRERAHRFDAGWLARFNDRVWTPDELTHHAPYKYILLAMGFAEAELDRQIAQTQERQFVHYGGDTPVHVTTFGMVQEYLTDNWHGLIAKLLREAAPQAAYMATRIKRRETLHTAWYRDMTALQIEANPNHVAYVAEEVARFRMPGNSLVPELQSQADRWLPLMGANFERIFRDLFRLLHQTLGNARLTGELLVRIAAEKGLGLGPVSARQVQAAINRLGGPGYGLIGEAALEMAGLDYVFKAQTERQDSGFRLYEGVYERIRSLLRTWLAREMAARVDFLPA